MQHLDPDPPRLSGFVSDSNLSTKWTIAVPIPPQEATSEAADPVWGAGVQKVRHVNGGPAPFEPQVKKRSLDSVKYVDRKVRPFLLGKVKF